MITDPIAVTLLLGTFLILILLGKHIAFAIGIATLVTTFYLGIPMQTAAQNMVKGINVFALLSVPFFILAGEIMGAGGISRRLIKLANALVGWLRGGLAMVNIAASMFFGGISGSPTADTSSIGSILIPMMKEDGYDGDFATTVTMASSIQGLLIPPSHNMIIYALAAGSVSIGQLFLAGAVPGILLGVALMIYCYFVSLKRNYPVGDKFNMKTALKAVWEAGLGLGTVLIVVIGVVGGIFTATESAAIAVVYAFIITFFVYREIPLSEMGGILTRSIKTLSIVMILIATSAAFGWIIAYLKIPAMITNVILGISQNKIVILLIINILLLVLGAMMDMVSIILIITPILMPVVTSIGVDPVHFGVIMILNLGIGLITPPVGVILFIGSAISGIKLEKLTRSMVPFYIVMLITLIIVTYFPQVVMFIPTHFMG
ncbi:TRAP transporter large permease [Petroclostridium sp. X23]|uniref:TRAP transporter large permease n=1 Tax=Petroclostridium sp. X23 TaxID=3045146 RepID=UPI0024ADF038|nr:TRAP transporter large permease [Petroclostridium sp. X23]WHH58016.1 TRAP transporter large permease [Petroclostridium sp. X23]